MKNKKIFQPTDSTPSSACYWKHGYFYFTPYTRKQFLYVEDLPSMPFTLKLLTYGPQREKMYLRTIF